MQETEIQLTEENEKSTSSGKLQAPSETLLQNLGGAISQSMNYVDDSIEHVHGLMRGLKIQPSRECKNVGQVLEVANAHNHTAQNIQLTLNCTKEIRNLLKLKLDAAEFVYKVKKES